MSITNLIHKIKSNLGLDSMTIVFLLVIVGVGIGSFALGRLTIPYNQYDNTAMVKKEDSIIKSDFIQNDEYAPEINQSEKRYVASKNGKMYYPLGCAGAKRIKKENEVWFRTAEEAEKSGYTGSSTCK